MPASVATTNLGPQVAVIGDGVYSETSTRGVMDLTGAALLSHATTASATSVLLADGEIAVTSIATSAAVLAFRSGNTTYTWSSTTAGVL